MKHVDARGDLTVLVPFHRLDDFLALAVKSVLRDLQIRDEVLLINDTGEAPAVVEGWLDKHSIPLAKNLRIVENSVRGIVGARNLGLRLAKSEYISFLDSDDIWLEGRRSRHLSILSSQPDLAGVTSDVNYICRHGSQIGRSDIHHPFLKKLIGPLADFFPRVRTSATTIKASLALEVGGFRESEVACEDFGLWLRLQTHKATITSDPIPGANYRIHQAQITNVIGSKALHEVRRLTSTALTSELEATTPRRNATILTRTAMSIRGGGLLALALGGAISGRRQWLRDLFSAKILLVLCYLHLTARSLNRSNCGECDPFVESAH